MASKEHDLISSIRMLQDVEKRLFSNLEASVASRKPLVEQEKIIDEMNKTAVTRTNLYKNLLSIYENQQSEVSDTRQDLVDQKAVVKIFEDEMNRAKANFNAIKQESANKLRMVEINTYFGKKYQAYANMLKIVVIACLPLILFALLSKRGLIPSGLSKGLSIIVIIIAGYLVLRRWIDLLSRDNMVFDQFNWQFDPARERKSSATGTFDLRKSADEWASSFAKDFGITCFGADCCSDGMRYDANTNKCVEAAAPEDSRSTEASVSNGASAHESATNGQSSDSPQHQANGDHQAASSQSNGVPVSGDSSTVEPISQ